MRSGSGCGLQQPHRLIPLADYLVTDGKAGNKLLSNQSRLSAFRSCFRFAGIGGSLGQDGGTLPRPKQPASAKVSKQAITVRLYMGQFLVLDIIGDRPRGQCLLFADSGRCLVGGDLLRVLGNVLVPSGRPLPVATGVAVVVAMKPDGKQQEQHGGWFPVASE